MATWNTYLQAIGYTLLLCFFIPIRINGPTEFEVQFQDYLKKFNKSYDDPEQYHNKLEAFTKSLQTIEALNANRSNDSASAQYGLTKYSDMLPHEFLTHHLQANLSNLIFKRKSQRIKRAAKGFLQKIDWREKNVVTKVKNQGSCGACWAFSGVQTIESINAIKSGNLVDLSVQEAIDCAGYNNDGCKGGDICSLLTWMKDNKVNLQLESEYPLKLVKNKCTMNKTSGVQIKDFECVNLVNSEDVILGLISANGPLAVAINAQTWQNYIGGVIEYHCDGNSSQMNHAVQIVGYDLTAKIPHYIVRNTWGEEFGDKGYLYLAIGKNMCGLANEVSALTVL